MTMTDEEILRKADEIKARRTRAQKGRDIMNADNVQIVAWKCRLEIARVDFPVGAELAATLCRLLDCDITEGAE